MNWRRQAPGERFLVSDLLTAAATVLAFVVVFVGGGLGLGLLSLPSGPVNFLFLLAGAALIAALVAILSAGTIGDRFFAETIKPVRRVTAGLRRLAKGHYSERIADDSPVHGNLASTFRT